MTDHHLVLGIALLAGTLLLLASRYFRRPRRSLPLRGWVGLGVILMAELLLAWRASGWLATYFTPVAWTGYLLLADGLVASLKGESRLSRGPGQFLALAFWSIPLWLIFEAYNLRLQNWAYAGPPLSPVVEDLSYAWAFATIWPAIHETADLIGALGFFQRPGRPRSPLSPGLRKAITVAGLLMVTAPVLLPARMGSYLFGAVWIGFVPLLDPIIHHWQGPSLLRDFEAGNDARVWCFLAAGWVCGILWEFWNYWAAARWIYIFPLGQHWKIFEMPAPGFAGFPPFAVECMVMYVFLRTLKDQLSATGKRVHVIRTEA